MRWRGGSRLKWIVGIEAVIVGVLIAVAAPQFLGGPSSVTVIACNGSETCHEVNITQRPASCDIPAYALESGETCEMTSSGISRVSLITDRANYVMAPLGDQNYTSRLMNIGDGTAWDLELLPDGRMLFTMTYNETAGALVLYDGEARDIARFDGVANHTAMVAMGMAVHPDFPEEPSVYVGITDRHPGTGTRAAWDVTQKVVRLRLDPDTGTVRNRTTIIQDLPGNVYSAGLELRFGPDGYLYVALGNLASQGLIAPLYPDIRSGKILRYTPNGDPAPGNPDGDAIYARGFKNSQGIAWHPETGEMYATMHGSTRHDELNRIVKGGNYGYPAYRCDERAGQGTLEKIDPSLYRDVIGPVWCSGEWTIAPSQAVFVDDPGHPWHGDLFVAGLRGQQVHRFDFRNGDLVDDRVFWYGTNAIRDVAYHDGVLYILPRVGHAVLHRLSPGR